MNKIEKVAFIPCETLSMGLQFNNKKVLTRLMEETGATHAEYHRPAVDACMCCSKYPFGKMEGVYHVVLTNPTTSLRDIRLKYSNSFARNIPIWSWYEGTPR